MCGYSKVKDKRWIFNFIKNKLWYIFSEGLKINFLKKKIKKSIHILYYLNYNTNKLYSL